MRRRKPLCRKPLRRRRRLRPPNRPRGRWWRCEAMIARACAQARQPRPVGEAGRSVIAKTRDVDPVALGAQAVALARVGRVAATAPTATSAPRAITPVGDLIMVAATIVRKHLALAMPLFVPSAMRWSGPSWRCANWRRKRTARPCRSCSAPGRRVIRSKCHRRRISAPGSPRPCVRAGSTLWALRPSPWPTRPCCGWRWPPKCRHLLNTWMRGFEPGAERRLRAALKVLLRP